MLGKVAPGFGAVGRTTPFVSCLVPFSEQNQGLSRRARSGFRLGPHWAFYVRKRRSFADLRDARQANNALVGVSRSDEEKTTFRRLSYSAFSAADGIS